MEKVIEARKCKNCWADFAISDKDFEFYDKISPVFGWTKYTIPAPTFCPECRQQRRLVFRNERYLYRRNSDASGKNIISMYSPDKEFKVYEQSEWWSDRWNPLDYGQDFDFSRSFFEQFDELLKEVPRLGLMLKDNENVEYWNDVETAKNCYLIFNAWDIEDSYYCSAVWQWSSDLMDCLWAVGSSNCYSCIKIKNAHNCQYCMDSKDIFDCGHCIDCIWCKSCFWCVWLQNKQYYIFNEKYWIDEYKIKMGGLKDMKRDELDKLIKLKQDPLPRKFIHSESSENAIWDYFNNSKNCINCYDMLDSEDCKYCYDWITIDTYDIFNCWTESYLLYESVSSYFSNNTRFSNFCHSSKELFYSDYCYYSSNLFWCVWLRNKHYCIFNKQYSKEEYEKLVPKIIEHMKKTKEWWEFFPASLSPFWYNETVANYYYPIERRDAINRISTDAKPIFNWSTYENPKPIVSKIIPSHKLPEKIEDVPDDVLNWAIECEVTWKPFRIIKQELEFYRKYKLPLPRKHPDQRNLEMTRMRNPRILYDRCCDNPKCEEIHNEHPDTFNLNSLMNSKTWKRWLKFKTTYSPEWSEIIYCEDCYNKEVV
ncbi:MAG: hypothetical protein ACD_2C00236G0001 [uncultured bacterium (gcode 4)]|uniref:Uncharacterized protein n=1 Tax=uncultured bacterium (gcode 4) TaxID=1234023 RepID=K2FD70_9BACT|nr:MAG: hypothetical protein ACD_2C00236G0001 [uncultured bacterium (gcode 4)]